MTDLNKLTAVEAATRIRDGRITCTQLTEACLARVAEREADVGAWAYINPDKALAEARQRDAVGPRGLLHGIPFGIKDVIDTVDMPTEYGSPIYKNHQPAWDAACVAQIREAGGVILGKAVSTEFATRHPGKTRNPHNLDHTPGGSSSGSAAAVADFMVPLAYGTQTTGSLIRPASYCGLVAYKPSFNMLDRAGMKPLAQSFDTIGIMARAVPDAALVVEALADYRVPASDWRIEGIPSIAFCRTPEWDKAQDYTQAAVENAITHLAKNGTQVKELTLPADFDILAHVHTQISEFELARALSYERLHYPEMISDSLMERINSGLHWTREDYENAWQSVYRCAALADEIFSEYAVIVAPSATGIAPLFKDGTGSPIFSQFWTPLALPCVTLPVLSGPKGLPLGLQVLGPPKQDARTLIHAERIFQQFTD